MPRTVKGVLTAVLSLALYEVAVFASGSTLPGSNSSAPAMTKEERAVESYRSGEEHRTKGKKLEDDAAGKDAKEVEKAGAKARGEFEKALKDFRNASQLNPNLFQAYNGLGYTLRKTGDYEKSLEMYEKAISMAPGFYSEAVEYRAEAHLALNRVEDAKKAYLELFAGDRKQADLLMASMTKWVALRKADAAGVDADTIASFDKWIGERSGLAKDVELMAIASNQTRW